MIRWTLALFACWLAASSGAAHPLSPVTLALEEQAAESYALVFRRSIRAEQSVRLRLPDACALREVARETSEDMLAERATLACAGSLQGRTISFEGLAAAGVGAIVSADFRSGHSVRAVLTGDAPSLVLTRETPPLQVFADYLLLGVEHLVTGFDHVLFVLGLLLMLPGLTRIVAVLTAFTLGHSLTLCLSALELVEVPSAPVELGIAASLIVVALELLGRAREAPLRGLFAMAVSFGLLHGLGFAGALRESGLPGHAIPLSLLGFNLGVELAQVGLVVVLAPALIAYQRLEEARATLARGVVGYAIGAVAAMWCLERVRPFL